jgi:hypothetical protein
LLDPDRGVTRLVRAIQDPKISRSDSIDGQLAWNVSGRIPATEVTSIVGGTPSVDEVGVTAVATDDGLVRRLVLRGRVVDGEKPDLARTFEFTSFDEPLQVELPRL